MPDARGNDVRIPWVRPRYIQRANAAVEEAWEKRRDELGHDQFVFVGPSGLEAHMNKGKEEEEEEDIFGLRQLFNEFARFDPYKLYETNFR